MPNRKVASKMAPACANPDPDADDLMAEAVILDNLATKHEKLADDAEVFSDEHLDNATLARALRSLSFEPSHLVAPTADQLVP